MKVGNRLSAEFTLECGVLQGSVLPLVIFLLVMDPLLRELKCNSLKWPLRLYTYGDIQHSNQQSAFITTTDPYMVQNLISKRNQ